MTEQTPAPELAAVDYCNKCGFCGKADQYGFHARPKDGTPCNYTARTRPAAPSAPDGDDGPIADAARMIASWAEGQTKNNVYKAAKQQIAALTRPNAEMVRRGVEAAAKVRGIAQEINDGIVQSAAVLTAIGADNMAAELLKLAKELEGPIAAIRAIDCEALAGDPS